MIPLLRNMFISKMLPPKKRAALTPGTYSQGDKQPETKQNVVLVSPPPSLGPGSSGQAWLVAKPFH